jgi:DNA modification methylase
MKTKGNKKRGDKLVNVKKLNFNLILTNMKIVYEKENTIETRYVICSICNKKVKRTIVPHLRINHPQIWDIFLGKMIEFSNKGYRPMTIQKNVFNTLFSWNVIQRELLRMKNINPGMFLIPQNINSDVVPDENLSQNHVNSTWKFTIRGKWSGHNSHYYGNWPPQVPRILIERYSKKGDLVVDPFLGGGTTMVEALLLERIFYGSDISPWAIEASQQHLDLLNKNQKINNSKSLKNNIIIKSDARKLNYIQNNTVDLICTHPPYGNILAYSHEKDDLSLISNVNAFLSEMKMVLKRFNEILKPNGYLSYMIGDVRKNGLLIPYHIYLANICLNGLKMKLIDVIIKEQYNSTVKKYYSHDKIVSRINHEYIYVFQKM